MLNLRTFDLNRPTKCLAMLGCHDLEGYDSQEATDPELLKYDFNVTVNKHVRGVSSDEFQIKRNGVQKFYTLSGTRIAESSRVLIANLLTKPCDTRCMAA